MVLYIKSHDITHMIHKRTVAGSNLVTHCGVDHLVQFAQNVSEGEHGPYDNSVLFGKKSIQDWE